MEQISSWLKHQFSNPQVVFLSAALVILFVIVVYAGDMLAPVLAGIVIAYLLDGIIKRLAVLRLPRSLLVWIVFLAFMLFLVLVVFGLLPTLYSQLTQVIAQIPSMLSTGQAALMTLPERYPDLFSQAAHLELAPPAPPGPGSRKQRRPPPGGGAGSATGGRAAEQRAGVR